MLATKNETRDFEPGILSEVTMATAKQYNREKAIKNAKNLVVFFLS